MFIEVREDEYVNLEQVVSIYLFDESETDIPKYRWFVETTNGQVFSKAFKNEEDARVWFKENIKPALEEYRKSKMVALQDIAQFVEGINYDTSIIREIFEKEIKGG